MLNIPFDNISFKRNWNQIQKNRTIQWKILMIKLKAITMNLFLPSYHSKLKKVNQNIFIYLQIIIIQERKVSKILIDSFHVSLLEDGYERYLKAEAGKLASRWVEDQKELD